MCLPLEKKLNFYNKSLTFLKPFEKKKFLITTMELIKVLLIP